MIPRTEFTELIKQLTEKTALKQLKWLQTTEDSAFRLGLGDGIVRIERGLDHENDRFFTITILNKKGQVIDELTQFQKGPLFPMLAELFGLARRSALAVDEILSSMFKDLNEGKTRPLPPEEKDDDGIPF